MVGTNHKMFRYSIFSWAKVWLNPIFQNISVTATKKFGIHLPNWTNIWKFWCFSFWCYFVKQMLKNWFSDTEIQSSLPIYVISFLISSCEDTSSHFYDLISFWKNQRFFKQKSTLISPELLDVNKVDSEKKSELTSSETAGYNNWYFARILKQSCSELTSCGNFNLGGPNCTATLNVKEFYLFEFQSLRKLNQKVLFFLLSTK